MDWLHRFFIFITLIIFHIILWLWLSKSQPATQRSRRSCAKHMNWSVKTWWTTDVISYTRSLSWTVSEWSTQLVWFWLAALLRAAIPLGPPGLQLHEVRINAFILPYVACWVTVRMLSASVKESNGSDEVNFSKSGRKWISFSVTAVSASSIIFSQPLATAASSWSTPVVQAPPAWASATIAAPKVICIFCAGCEQEQTND